MKVEDVKTKLSCETFFFCAVRSLCCEISSVVVVVIVVIVIVMTVIMVIVIVVKLR